MLQDLKKIRKAVLGNCPNRLQSSCHRAMATLDERDTCEDRDGKDTSQGNDPNITGIRRRPGKMNKGLKYCCQGFVCLFVCDTAMKIRSELTNFISYDHAIVPEKNMLRKIASWLVDSLLWLLFGFCFGTKD